MDNIQFSVLVRLLSLLSLFQCVLNQVILDLAFVCSNHLQCFLFTKLSFSKLFDTLRNPANNP